MAILDSQFWDKLTRISQSAGMDPKDLLAVMYYESGLDPAAHNKNGDASGLIQFMPETLDKLGFEGNHSEFRQLDALKQLDYVSEYINNKAQRGGFKSAAQYYVANLWPVALKLSGVQEEDPNTVIIDSNPQIQRYPGVSLAYERAAYKANQGLDVNHDGKITYGDLQAVMNGVKRSSGYQNAVAKLSSGQSITVGQGKHPQNEIAQNTPSNQSWDKLETLLNQFMTALSSYDASDRYLTKLAYARTFLPNQMVIKIGAAHFDTAVEFARILSAALEEELYASNVSIHANKQQVEVGCSVDGPRELSVQATLQLCNALSEMFEEATHTIGGCRVQTTVVPNKTSDHSLLDINTAQDNYNRFHLRFVQGSSNG